MTMEETEIILIPRLKWPINVSIEIDSQIDVTNVIPSYQPRLCIFHRFTSIFESSLLGFDLRLQLNNFFSSVISSNGYLGQLIILFCQDLARSVLLRDSTKDLSNSINFFKDP